MQETSPPSETLFTPNMIEVLRDAYKSPKTRHTALNDPRHLLSEHGIVLAAEGEFHIYERVPVRSGLWQRWASWWRAVVRNEKSPSYRNLVSAPLFDRVQQQYETLQPAPEGWDRLWRDTHGGCPYPTIPYKTKKKVSVCDAYGVWVSGKDWVQDVSGTPFGHWQYNTVSFCLFAHEEEVEVTECLPPH